MPLVVQELLTLLEHMSYYRLFNKSNTTYASSGPGTANSSGAPEPSHKSKMDRQYHDQTKTDTKTNNGSQNITQTTKH
jgi:hypothetical protein